MAEELVDDLDVGEAGGLVENGVHARATVDVWVGALIEEEGDDGRGAVEGEGEDAADVAEGGVDVPARVEDGAEDGGAGGGGEGAGEGGFEGVWVNVGSVLEEKGKGGGVSVFGGEGEEGLEGRWLGGVAGSPF